MSAVARDVCADDAVIVFAGRVQPAAAQCPTIRRRKHFFICIGAAPRRGELEVDKEDDRVNDEGGLDSGEKTDIKIDGDNKVEEDGEDDGGDAEKIGVLYWLGRSLDAQGKHQEAVKYYHRIIAVDVSFRDAGDRLAHFSGDVKG